jgi:hypothetical protein
LARGGKPVEVAAWAGCGVVVVVPSVGGGRQRFGRRWACGSGGRKARGRRRKITEVGRKTLVGCGYRVCGLEQREYFIVEIYRCTICNTTMYYLTMCIVSSTMALDKFLPKHNE